MRYFGRGGKNKKRGVGKSLIKTIFGNKMTPVAPKNHVVQQHDLEEKKQRKKRSDAKQDIKFKLSLEDRQKLKSKAIDHKVSLTAIASMIVETELKQQPKIYENYHYDHSGKFVHVMIDQDSFKLVQRLSVEWDCNYRQVAHRIVKDYLKDVHYGVRIFNHRG